MSVQKKCLSVFISFVLAIGPVPSVAFALPAANSSDASVADAGQSVSKDDIVGNDEEGTLGVVQDPSEGNEDALDEGKKDNSTEVADSPEKTGENDVDEVEEETSGEKDLTAQEAEEVAVQSADPASKKSVLEPQASTAPVITATMHVQDYGDRKPVKGGTSSANIIGTTGQAKRVEALSLSVAGVQDLGITYEAHVQDIGWQGWKSDGERAGTSGQAKRLEALRIKLTGAAAANYDVYYRVHAQDYGWMAWTSNGACAGTSGQCKRLEAVQVTIVPAGSGAPSSYAPAQTNSSSYRTAWGTGMLGGQAHVQDYGWMSQIDCSSSRFIGTTGKAKRLEAFKLTLDSSISGSIQYKAHVQNEGWQGWKSSGQTAGTTGRGLRVEAVQVRLTGQAASLYDVYYRAHVADVGWMAWACNGEEAGTTALARNVEALQVVLVKKGAGAPSSSIQSVTSNAVANTPVLSYSAQLKNGGWQGAVASTKTAGTTGQSKMISGIKVSVSNAAETFAGSISYRGHFSDDGWLGWASNGAQMVGSSNSHQMEAVQIKLTGALASNYDVYYRVHVADFGWLGWAKNGQSAGSEGRGLGVQAIQITAVPKGTAAPGTTKNYYLQETYSIMGSSNTTVAQMVRYFNSLMVARGKTYPSSALGRGGASTINAFCTLAYNEAMAEGVRPEVLFAQVIHETGALQFGGDVKVGQFNFGGLGATGGGNPGLSFPSVQIGLRAQVQHLKAYASTAPLNKACVDPRFNYVNRGCAKTVDALGGTWAAAGGTYGPALRKYMDEMLRA